MKIALIAGSTGLIGNQLLSLLLNDDSYSVVKAISRKPLDITHPKLENIVLDFDQMAQHSGQLKADDVFCCLGTTIKKVKTKEKFRQVDFDYPLALARISKANGARQYLLVSALGADKKSSIFYNQVKGEVEEAIGEVAFTSFQIFRPSLLMGDRQENRSGEEAGKVFFKYFGFLVPKKYKGIDSIKVARAMQAFAKIEKPGTHIHESAELQEY
ncbi:MAG: NAD-dependent epimerase/dehydratase family protein [Cyclobacteriaceae bacterium]|nr:MAG: NAD-dependent epimerase/dehydratase family protein [Cyclobacteriaceae bacterium]